MIKKYYFNNLKKLNIPKNVSCIGYFDGVHLGHQALIKKTVELAKKNNVDPFLITFFPDPADVLSKERIKHINSFDSRCKLFEKFGIKGIIVIDFDKKLRMTNYKDFINKYLKKLNIISLVCGYDYRFGFKGEGDYKKLKRLSKNLFDVNVVDEVTYYGIKISSSRIREEILHKNYNLVNKLCGYKYHG